MQRNNNRCLRLFDARKYKEIEPLLAQLRDQSISINELSRLIRSGIYIVESDEFKLYNDNEDREFFLEPFQYILDLIETQRIAEWFSAQSHQYTSIEPDSLFASLIVLLCCPKYQAPEFSEYQAPDFSKTEDTRLPSDTTIGYYSGIGTFYSLALGCFQDIHSAMEEIGMETLLVDAYSHPELEIFTHEKLLTFSQVVYDDYRELSDPSKEMYAIYQGGSTSKLVMLEESPTPKQLKGCRAEKSIHHRERLLSFYIRLVKLVDLANLDCDYTIITEYYG
jgi:hypothetical protein